MSNAQWEPQHFGIMTVDIEGFGSTTRTDPVRAGLRTTLDSMIDRAVSNLPTHSPVTAVGDTGDGKWILFNPAMPKTRVLTTVVPTLEAQLKHYNLAASSAAMIRLRIGVHHGELIPDATAYAGEALNHAFRIIDNEVARQALRATSRSSITVISNDFFDKIVRPGYGNIEPNEYSPVQIDVKETTTVVWLNSRVAADDQGAKPKTHAPPDGQVEQPIITLDDLPPNSLYVAVTDVHNRSLYQRSFPETPVRQHIEAALLLADKVVIHCADPYRSKTVADTVFDLLPCVEAGDLLFLLGENIQDSGSRFRSYIDYKVEQYRKSRYGTIDVRSLTDVDEDAVDRAEDLLGRSPNALIRGFSGTDGFIRLTKNDMQPREAITIREHYTSSIVSRLGLSVRQLLDLSQLSADGKLTRLVADDQTVGAIQFEIERLSGHNSFSRQIFLEALRQRGALSSDHPLDEALQERVNLIHLMGTIGPLTHTEITNRRDRASPYYYSHLIEHLGVLGEVSHPHAFGAPLVLELRALPSWPTFAAHHIRLIANMIHREAGGWRATDLDTCYRWSRRIPEFSPIRSVVRSHWT